MFTFSMFREYLTNTKNYRFEKLKQLDMSKTKDEWFQFIIDFLQHEIEFHPDERKIIFKCFKYLNYPENYNDIKDFSIIKEFLSELESTLYLMYQKEENINRLPFFDIVSKNIRITEVQIHFLEKHNLKTSLKEQDLYTFAHYLIFKVRDVGYVSELLKTFPDVINLKDNDNVYLFDVLFEKYLRVLRNFNNMYLVLYYDKIFNLFLQTPKLPLPLVQQKKILKELYSLLHEIKYSDLNEEKKEKIILFIDRSISNIGNTYLPPSVEKIGDLYNISFTFPSIILPKKNSFSYEDLREEMVISVDSKNTELRDDAFSFKRKSNGNYELGIYTPAVADFISLNSVLDKEARKRGQSIYGLKDHVDMFPVELAYKNFSLNCCMDRFALGCFFEFNHNMEFTTEEPVVKRCLIRPNYNLNHEQVAKLLSREKNRGKKKELYRMLQDLVVFLEEKELKRLLPYHTFYGQSLDERLGNAIDKEEMRKIYRYYSSYIIQLFKLLTGSTVAQTINKKGLPFLYHSNPSSIEKSILNEMPPENEDIDLYLSDFHGSPHYSIESMEHRNFHIPSYCRWTTPMREYMSLVTQRLVIRYLVEERFGTDKELVSLEKYLKNLCKEMNLRNLLNNEYAEECRKLYKMKKR